MKVSAKVEYALRALIHLGRHRGTVIPLNEIAAETFVPLRFLSRILVELKNHGFVRSIRGVNGGYQLRMLPERICVGEVIKKLEGPLVTLYLEEGSNNTTNEMKQKSTLKPLWLEISKSITDILHQTTVADFIDGCFAQNDEVVSNNDPG